MYSRTHSQMITCIKIYFVLQDTCQLHAASISCKENFVQNVDAILLIPCQIIHIGWQNNIAAPNFHRVAKNYMNIALLFPQINTQHTARFFSLKFLSKTFCKDKD